MPKPPPPSTLPKYDPSATYGMFGFAGYCCDIAVRNDDARMAEECWRLGWMDADTRMLVGTVIEECRRRAPKVAECLARLGPTQREPVMP